MSGEKNREASKYERWSAKSDQWLAAVLHGEDTQDIDLAMQILHDRYQDKLESYVAKKLPEDWVDNVTQNIWIGFYGEIKAKGVKKRVSNLLWTIAKRRRVDFVRQLTAERKIEADIPINGGDSEEGLQLESLEEPFEEQLEKQVQLRFLRQIPFIDSLLSDCERVLWVLREQLEYPSPVVARLTDKQPQTVYSALSAARKKAKEYTESEEFDLMVSNQELAKITSPSSRLGGSLLVERFSNCIAPQLTPDELKPLALTNEEFRANYVASLILPREPHEGGEAGLPSFLLTRRPDWDDMEKMFQKLYQDRQNTDWLSPEECLVKIDRDHDHIILTVEQMLEFLPEPKEWSGSPLSDNTYFSVHSPRLTIPVTLGFFDSSLFTPELYRRWPFLPEDAGL